ncbi:hypothetical protein ACFWIY_17340 [Streptomyces sioyaensis]|uniref:hypothetical protein n=1 Tax=Streptomyces sioyaensis TaxID=67364 RepID=UPI0036625DBE
MLTLGGGLPTGYGAGVPALEAYGKVIRESLGRHFPDPPRLIIEPGRSSVCPPVWEAKEDQGLGRCSRETVLAQIP